jgi:hypothetical protein
VSTRRLALVALVGVAGCGQHAMVAVTGGDLSLFTLQQGTYVVSNLVASGDGCGLALDGDNFATQAVNNNGNGAVSLGYVRNATGMPPTFDPAAYTGGNGHFSDGIHGMTMTQTHVVADDGTPPCEYDWALTNVLTITGNDRLHVTLSNSDSNIVARCTMPPPTRCTSSWSYDLTFQPPPDLSAPHD